MRQCLSRHDIRPRGHRQGGILSEATGADTEILFEITREVGRMFVTQFKRNVLEWSLISNQLDRPSQAQTPKPLVRCGTVLDSRESFQLPRRNLAFARELDRTIAAAFCQRGPICDLIQSAAHNLLCFVCPSIRPQLLLQPRRIPGPPHLPLERANSSCAGSPRRSATPSLAGPNRNPEHCRTALRAISVNTAQECAIFQKYLKIFSGSRDAARSHGPEGVGGILHECLNSLVQRAGRGQSIAIRPRETADG